MHLHLKATRVCRSKAYLLLNWSEEKRKTFGFFCSLSSVGGSETRRSLWSVAKNGLSWQQAFLPDQIIDLCLCCVPAKPWKVDVCKDSGRLCGDQMGARISPWRKRDFCRRTVRRENPGNITWGAAPQLEPENSSFRLDFMCINSNTQ